MTLFLAEAAAGGIATGGMVHVVCIVALFVLALALVACTVRMAIGPSLSDRVIALDLLLTVAAAMVAVHGIATDEPAMLRVVMAVSLVGFLGTVAFALYIERRGKA